MQTLHPEEIRRNSRDLGEQPKNGNHVQRFYNQNFQSSMSQIYMAFVKVPKALYINAIILTSESHTGGGRLCAATAAL